MLTLCISSTTVIFYYNISTILIYFRLSFMQIASILNPCEINQIAQPLIFKASKLQVLTQKCNALAALVEKEWNNFSVQERNVLKAIIYTYISENNGIRSFFSSLRVRLSLAWILIKGETGAVVEYLTAFRHLKNAVLGAVETEHCDYEKNMALALQEALNELDNSSAPLTPAQFREWLTAISD